MNDIVTLVLLAVFIAVCLIQLVHVLFYVRVWLKEVNSNMKVDLSSVGGLSVVIPARNESMNILSLLRDLENQNYNDFEVIVVDDCSEDNTADIVEEFSGSSNLNVLIVRQDHPITGFSPKKSAIYRGVQNSSNSIVVTTDADCRVGPNWLTTISYQFSRSKIDMLCGPVRVRIPRGLLGYLQYLEMAAVMFYSSSTMLQKRPTMVNGANLAFNREKYLELGYGDKSGHPSGDDIFLMERFLKSDSERVMYNMLSGGIVETAAVESWKDYLEQRKRWTSKWRNYSQPYTKRLAFAILAFNLNKVLGFVLLLFTGYFSVVLSFLVLIILLEGTLLSLFFRQFRSKFPILRYLLMSPIYPPLSLLTGIMSIKGGYSWKGRSYSVK